MPPSASASFVSSSGSSIGGALAGINRQLTGNKSKISIHIDNHYQAKAYTSKSTVAGHVAINPGTKDMRFDHLQIQFVGFTKTRVDGSRATQKSKHIFLQLHMPIDNESYPVPRVFDADQTYTIPFKFVIPENLVISTCKHECQNANVLEHHRALPPSMGHWQKDDMSPDMAHVNYAIKAHLYRDSDEFSERIPAKKQKVTIMAATQLINVLPAFHEQPPLGLSKRDKEYTMTKSKTIKKSIISPKLGELTVTAVQPAAVMLSADGRVARSTKVMLDLRFDPSTAQSSTPKILHVGGRITGTTYFTLAGMGYMPNLGDWVKTHGIEGRGSYASSVGLPDFPVKNVGWARNIHPRSRRDSGYGSEEYATSGSDAPDDAGRQRTAAAPTAPFYYQSTLQVPIDLPVQKRAFIPTFHSCIASRVYMLTLNVVVSSGASNTTLTVVMPLQIGVESTRQPALGDPVPPSFEEAVEEAAIEGPSIQNRGELPGYSESR